MGPSAGVGVSLCGVGGSFPKSLSRAFHVHHLDWELEIRDPVSLHTLGMVSGNDLYQVEMFIDLSVQIQLLIITAWRQRAPLLSKPNPLNPGPVLCVRTPGLMDVS